MRKTLLCGTAALALSVGTARAGGMAEPVMEPEVVAATTTSSAGGLVVPLLLLVLVAAAASGGSQVAGSDARIKTDIEWVGMARGLPLYHYRYKGSATRFEGVMAQDVLASRPDAVVRYDSGMLAVDYAMLGLKLRVIH